MTGRKDRNGSLAWLVVGLSVHGLAAVLLLANVLSSGEPGEQELAPRARAIPVEAPAGSAALELGSAPREGAEGLAAALEDD